MADHQNIPPFLYAYYLEGYTAKEAHQKLSNITGQLDFFTVEQVQEHYGRFKRREFTIFGEGPAPEDESELTLLKLIGNTPICESLMSQCGLSEILTLRKVCHAFFDAVSTDKRKIAKLVLSGNKTTKQIQAGHDFHVKYEQVTGGFVVSNGNRVKYIKDDGTLVDLVGRDLRIIMGNPKLEIRELDVGFSMMMAFLEATKLSSEKLKVQQLNIGLFQVLEKVLPSLKPGELKVLKVVNMLNEVQTADGKDVYEMEQWKGAKELITDLVYKTTNFVRDFSHFDYLDYVVERNNTIPVAALVELKEIFLQRPTFQKLEIMPGKYHTPNDPLFKANPPEFARFQDPVNKEYYHFPYPNSPDQKLTIQICFERVLFRGPMYTGDKITIENRREKTQEEVQGRMQGVVEALRAARFMMQQRDMLNNN